MRSALITGICLALLGILNTPAFAQKIVIISDINGSYGSTEYNSRVSNAVEAIIKLEPDLVISAGDMVAGQKQPSLDQEHLDRMWASFNRVVADPLVQAGIDFIVTPGNHDGSGFREFELEQKKFQAQWNDRRPGLSLLEGSNWPRRYALWLGKVLIITIDGTRPGRLQNADLNLLRATLEREGPKTQSILVVSHLPMWPFAQGRENEIITDPALTALLAQHQVDYFISGHHHVYYPGIDDNKVGHLGVGALGGNARKFVGQSMREPFSFAVLEFCDSGYRFSARKAPLFVEDVPLTSLPASINGQTGSLQRLDLSKEYPGRTCAQ
jgi:3',5'-cyclic AMP phosphodiesterase CpdA